MKLNKKAVTIAVLAAGMTFTGMASADIYSAMTKIDGDELSGNKSGTVNANCSDYSGQYDGATAMLSTDQSGTSTDVEITVTGARPDTHYTAWVRVKGKSHGIGFGGSPVTNGGATPLAPSTELGNLIDDWDGPGSATGGANSFFTDEDGEGELTVVLDFPLEGGSYPFNNMSAADLAQADAKTGVDFDSSAAPTAIANPHDANVGPGSTPFLIRVVSHCQDDKSHGMSPSKREPWFQY